MEIICKILVFPFIIWLWISPIVTLVYFIKQFFNLNLKELKFIIIMQIIAMICLGNYFNLYGDPKGIFFSEISFIHILMMIGLGFPTISFYTLKTFK